MINQYTTPLTTIGIIIFILINAPSLNVALNLYFLKKKILFYMKKSFYQDFPRLKLNKNTKTMTSNCLYLYSALC